ncbi:MAG: hypothetical protein BWX92_01858 [Deltaproteobacteria bacterium ADurb.Bin135]|nr:MAG: hypothetical protein BWX92_01858 [Deltaproteobacteria bacterium ADurb.Bin135]
MRTRVGFACARRTLDEYVAVIEVCYRLNYTGYGFAGFINDGTAFFVPFNARHILVQNGRKGRVFFIAFNDAVGKPVDRRGQRIRVYRPAEAYAQLVIKHTVSCRAGKSNRRGLFVDYQLADWLERICNDAVIIILYLCLLLRVQVGVDIGFLFSIGRICRVLVHAAYRLDIFN